MLVVVVMIVVIMSTIVMENFDETPLSCTYVTTIVFTTLTMFTILTTQPLTILLISPSGC
jgi:hypothetical protein